MFSSKVKLEIFDANSSWKSIFDDESFEFQVKLNTAVFWSKVKCKKLLQKRCIPPSLKENSLCSTTSKTVWSITWRLSHLVVFNLTFFEILVLLLSKWEFHIHLSIWFDVKLLKDSRFLHLLARFDCHLYGTSMNCQSFSNLTSNHVHWSYSKMNGEIYILIRAILKSRKW